MVTKARMDALVASLPSKSAKMRALDKAGVSRAEIARFLGTRYQFVRNVLEAERRKEEEPSAASLDDGVALTANHNGTVLRGKLRTHGGTLTLPREFLNEIGAGDGDTIAVEIEGDELRLRTMRSVLRDIQDRVRDMIPPGVSLVDELIAERRRESERETRGD